MILLLYCLYSYFYIIGLIIGDCYKTKEYPSSGDYLVLIFSPILLPIIKGMNDYKNV